MEKEHRKQKEHIIESLKAQKARRKELEQDLIEKLKANIRMLLE